MQTQNNKRKEKDNLSDEETQYTANKQIQIGSNSSETNQQQNNMNSLLGSQNCIEISQQQIFQTQLEKVQCQKQQKYNQGPEIIYQNQQQLQYIGQHNIIDFQNLQNNQQQQQQQQYYQQNTYQQEYNNQQSQQVQQQQYNNNQTYTLNGNLQQNVEGKLKIQLKQNQMMEQEIEKLQKQMQVLKEEKQNEITNNQLQCTIHQSSDCLLYDILFNKNHNIQACSENIHENQYICTEAAKKWNKDCPFCKKLIQKISGNELGLLKVTKTFCPYCYEKITQENFSEHILEQFDNINVKPLEKVENQKRCIKFKAFFEGVVLKLYDIENIKEIQPIQDAIEKTKKDYKYISQIIWGFNFKFEQKPQQTDTFVVKFPMIENSLYVTINDFCEEQVSQQQRLRGRPLRGISRMQIDI